MRGIVEALKKRIINLSNFKLFGIDISGKTFIIQESLIINNTPFTNFIKFEIGYENQPIESELYPIPEHGRPTVLKQMGIMIFISEQDMANEIKKFGSPINLVQTYMLEETNLFFGAGKTIVNMSKNDYWITEGNRVFKIPICDETWKNEYFHRNNLNEQDTGDKDLMVIFTYVGGNPAEGRLKITNYNNRWVKRFAKNMQEPIIIEDSNLFLFSSKEAAEYFISEYNGSIANYYEKITSKIVVEKHSEELKDMSFEYKKDKLAIAKTASLIAGSTLLFEGARIGITYVKQKLAEKAAEKVATAGLYYIGSRVGVGAIASAVPVIGTAVSVVLGLLGLDKLTIYLSDRDDWLGSIGRGVQTVKKKIGGFFCSIGGWFRDRFCDIRDYFTSPSYA